MLPEVISDILHRDIIRVHTRLENVDDRLFSLQESQYGGMVKVHTRLEKLEMDSEDLQAALRSLGDGNPNSQTRMRISTPGRRPRNSSEPNADEVPKGEEEKLEDLERESQNAGLVQALEGILGQVEILEKRVIWLWNHHRSLRQDIDWMRSEYTRHEKDLKELRLLVKSPQGSLETCEERRSQINPQEQPMLPPEEGYESSRTTRYQEEGLTVPGGISSFDHFQQIGLSHANVEASDKSQMEGPGPSPLPANFSHTFPLDLDLRTNIEWDTAENTTGSPEREANMDIDTHAEDQLPDTPSSTRTDVKDATSFHPSHEVSHTQKLFVAGNLGLQESLKEELKLDRPGGLSSVPQLHLKPQQQAGEGTMDELKGAASNIVGGGITDIPHMPSTGDSENVSTPCVREENSAKTNKVLEAYRIDLLVED